MTASERCQASAPPPRSCCAPCRDSTTGHLAAAAAAAAAVEALAGEVAAAAVQATERVAAAAGVDEFEGGQHYSPHVERDQVHKAEYTGLLYQSVFLLGATPFALSLSTVSAFPVLCPPPPPQRGAGRCLGRRSAVSRQQPCTRASTAASCSSVQWFFALHHESVMLNRPER